MQGIQVALQRNISYSLVGMALAECPCDEKSMRRISTESSTSMRIMIMMISISIPMLMALLVRTKFPSCHSEAQPEAQVKTGAVMSELYDSSRSEDGLGPEINLLVFSSE